MALLWHSYHRAVVVDASNCDVAVRINGVTETLSIAQGVRFLRGDGAVDDLVRCLDDAIATHTESTSEAVGFSLDVDPDEPCATVEIQGDSTTSFAILWADAATTVDPAWWGFASSNTTYSAADKVSTLTPSTVWLADKPPVDWTPSYEVDGDQAVLVGGRVRDFTFGGPYTSHATGFANVDDERTRGSVGDPSRGFLTFWAQVLDGSRFEVRAGSVSSGTVLGATTLLDTVVLDVDSRRGFAPTRLVSQALWSWRLSLRRWVQ